MQFLEVYSVQGLIDWSKSAEIAPKLEASQEQVDGSPRPSFLNHENQENLTKPRSDTQSRIDIPEELEVAQPTHKTEEDSNLSPLALMNPKNQLFLDGVVFAADDSEAVAALKSITLHRLWAKAYLSPKTRLRLFLVPAAKGTQPWTAEVQREFLRIYKEANNLNLPQGYNYCVGGEVVEPRLMQKHVAVLAKEHRQFLVMSDMGTGKSLAAQLAVKADGAKRIL